MSEKTLDKLIRLEDKGEIKEMNEVISDVCYWEGIPRWVVPYMMKARRYDLLKGDKK